LAEINPKESKLIPGNNTTENVVANNGKRCNEEELQRNPLRITTENRTVVHPSEIVHLSEESSSAYVGKFTTVGGAIESLSLQSQNQQQPRKPNTNPVQGDTENPPVLVSSFISTPTPEMVAALDDCVRAAKRSKRFRFDEDEE